MRVLLLNPDSLFVPALENHYGYGKGELTNHIRYVTEKWEILAKEAEDKKTYFTDKKYRRTHRRSYKTKEYGSIEIYYYNGQPTNSIYRIDDKLIVVNTKTSHEKSIHLPYMIYKKNNSQIGMYDLYLNEYNKIIEEATKIEMVEKNEECEVS